ncbi:hypothetical protein HY486_01440 [Candidatus Woesearchaeota archaeon]|nr:hypothetical protein [Candidatus Woesearchaeota archaeon]
MSSTYFSEKLGAPVSFEQVRQPNYELSPTYLAAYTAEKQLRGNTTDRLKIDPPRLNTPLPGSIWNRK